MIPSTEEVHGCNEYFCFQESMEDSKKRWNDRTSKNFWSAKQLTDSSSIEKWLQARKKIGKDRKKSIKKKHTDLIER